MEPMDDFIGQRFLRFFGLRDAPQVDADKGSAKEAAAPEPHAETAEPPPRRMSEESVVERYRGNPFLEIPEKIDEPKTEEPQVEQKLEEPAIEAKREEPKTDEPKTDEPKTEEAKREEPEEEIHAALAEETEAEAPEAPEAEREEEPEREEEERPAAHVEEEEDDEETQ